jgi:hypothetical protein
MDINPHFRCSVATPTQGAVPKFELGLAHTTCTLHLILIIGIYLNNVIIFCCQVAVARIQHFEEHIHIFLLEDRKKKGLLIGISDSDV